LSEPIVIGYGACKWIKEANTKAVHLYNQGSGIKTMHDSQTGLDYQVPAGKKLIMLSFTNNQISTGSSSSGQLYESASINSATGTTKLEFGADESNNAKPMPVYITFASTKYVNASFGSSTQFLFMLCVETDT